MGDSPAKADCSMSFSIPRIKVDSFPRLLEQITLLQVIWTSNGQGRRALPHCKIESASQRNREANGEHAAFALSVATYLDKAPMRVDEILDERKTHTEAAI